MARYLDPKADLTFKKVFGEHKELVISFLNALLPLEPGRQIETIEYLAPELVPRTPTGKDNIVDVRCEETGGRKFIVEMQLYWRASFKQRVLLNAAMVTMGVLAGLMASFQQFWREMPLGSGRLDLGVKFRGATYAVEVKTTALYQKSLEASHDQMCRCIDQLGIPEGWLVVADSDLSKPWDGKISTTDIPANGKTTHLVRC